MDVLVGYLLPLAAFLVFYAVVQRRAAARGVADPNAWRWLAVVLAAATAGVVAGQLLT